MNGRKSATLSQLLGLVFQGEIQTLSQAKQRLTSFLKEGMTLRALPKKRQFIDSVQYPGEVFLLVCGSCQVGASSPEGGEMIAELLSAPQILGIPELFLGAESYRANVFTSSPSVLLSIKREVFLELLEQDVEAWRFLAGHLAQLAMRNMDKVRQNALMNRREYLALYLLETCEGKMLPYRIPDSRSTIAAHLNINLRTLFRYIERLEQAGCLTIQNRKMLITQENWERLREVTKQY